jgi:hypothetical protein
MHTIAAVASKLVQAIRTASGSDYVGSSSVQHSSEPGTEACRGTCDDCNTAVQTPSAVGQLSSDE